VVHGDLLYLQGILDGVRLVFLCALVMGYELWVCFFYMLSLSYKLLCFVLGFAI
jgi:hypothetical protein